MPTSTANWHWKNKNVTHPWAKEWFKRELTSIELSPNGEGAKERISISDMTEFDGDVELGQRKSKLITIYDVRIVLNWAGVASDGTEVNGRLTIPEVSHEITLDKTSDYSYEWSLSTSSSSAVDAIYALAKKHLTQALEAKFDTFPKAIVDTHGKDLTIIGSNEPSRTGTPNPAASAPATATAATAAAKPVTPKPARALNTSKVVREAVFMAAADDLYSLLSDEKRIPAWTRAPAQSNPTPGADYSLFGGGVKGKYISLSPGKEIVQTWALQSPTWPAGHNATLTTTFAQSSDSTTVTLSLDGVPTGTEDEITRNLDGYYIQGLKSIGYVQLVVSPSRRRSSSRAPSPKRKRASKVTKKAKAKSSGGLSAGAVLGVGLGAGALALGLALVSPRFSQFLPLALRTPFASAFASASTSSPA